MDICKLKSESFSIFLPTPALRYKYPYLLAFLNTILTSNSRRSCVCVSGACQMQFPLKMQHLKMHIAVG